MCVCFMNKIVTSSVCTMQGPTKVQKDEKEKKKMFLRFKWKLLCVL